MSKLLVSVAGLALAAAASATQPGSVSGPGVTINDLATATTAPVAAPGAIVVTGVSFTGLRHTWVGDLSMTLTGPGAGNSFNFFHRPGQTSATGVGQSADFVATNSYAFSDTGSAWQTTGTVINSGTYAPIRSPFAPAQAINSFAQLNGSTAGSWTLTVSDNAGGDTGAFTGWTLNYKVVPTPGAAALMGVAGLAGLRRRR